MAWVSESQVLEALRAAMPKHETDDDAQLCTEIAEQLGLSIPQTGRYLRALVRAGQVEVVRKRCQGIDGTVRPQPAYRIVTATV